MYYVDDDLTLPDPTTHFSDENGPFRRFNHTEKTRLLLSHSVIPLEPKITDQVSCFFYLVFFLYVLVS